jgi:hypothetical protein
MQDANNPRICRFGKKVLYRWFRGHATGYLMGAPL